MTLNLPQPGSDRDTWGAKLNAALTTLDSEKLSIKEAAPTPQRHGAIGDGVADDTAALTAFLSAGYSQGYVPRGTYRVTSGLTQPGTMSVSLDDEATIKATTAMPILWGTPVGTQVRRKVLRGGVFDCNDLAQTAISLPWIAHFELLDVDVLNAAGHAVILGDTAADTSYEAQVHNLNIDRPSRTAKPAGSYGLWLRNCFDSKIVQAMAIGSDTGFRNDKSDNHFIACHAWGYSNSLPTVCFDENGSGNTYTSCVADTPTAQGWRIRSTGAGNTIIVGGKTFLNSLFGVDNTVTAIQVDETGSAFLTVVGHHFQGNDATHRLKQDIAVADAANPSILGNQYTNVVTQLANQNRLRAGLQVGGGITSFNTTHTFGLAQIYATAGNTRYVQWSTGGSVAGASSRWQAGANATAEGGSNAGSDWDLVSRTDSGAFLSTVLRAFRSNGVVQALSGGFATRVKGGTPADADYAVAPPDGTLVADSTGSRLWVRLGGAWKSVTVA